MQAWRIILGLIVLCGVVIAGAITWHRIEWESHYDQVGIMVSLSQLNLLAQNEGLLLNAALQKLREVGVVTVNVTPWEVKEWRGKAFKLSPWSTSGKISATTDFTLEQLRDIQKQGFAIALMVDSIITMDREDLSDILPLLEDLQLQGIYFSGWTLWGWPQEILELTDWLNQHKMQWGAVEFSEPPGDRELFLAGAKNFARVHRIKDEELAELSQFKAVERWERAVVERNIRILEVRLRPTSLSENLAYLDAIKNQIRHAGFLLDWPDEMPTFRFPGRKWINPTLGIAFLSLWALILMKRWKWRLSWLIEGWLLLSSTVMMLMLWWDRQLLPWFVLMIVVSAPILSYLVVSDSASWRKSSIARGVVNLFVATLVSVSSGILAAALMSTETYFLKLDEFQRVKISLLVPLLLIFLLELTRHGWSSFLKFWSRQIRLTDCLLLGLGAIALAVVLLRSGNFSIIPVPEAEQNIRNVLEDWLYARPRFKEFLVGHPLLILWMALGRERLGFYGPFVLAASYIGQVSILNTFVHMHTPWILSLQRTMNGLVAGIFVGLLFYGLVQAGIWGWRRWATRA